MTALCPHGFLLLSEAGDGVSGIKKVAQGLEGGGPEFSVCFSCGARLQHKVVDLHLRRCCGASGLGEGSATHHGLLHPSGVAGVMVWHVSMLQGQPSPQGPNPSPILPAGVEPTRESRRRARAVLPRCCKETLTRRVKRVESRRRMAEMVIKAALGLICQATNDSDNQEPATTACWPLSHGHCREPGDSGGAGLWLYGLGGR